MNGAVLEADVARDWTAVACHLLEGRGGAAPGWRQGCVKNVHILTYRPLRCGKEIEVALALCFGTVRKGLDAFLRCCCERKHKTQNKDKLVVSSMRQSQGRLMSLAECPATSEVFESNEKVIGPEDVPEAAGSDSDCDTAWSITSACRNVDSISAMATIPCNPAEYPIGIRCRLDRSWPGYARGMDIPGA